MESLHTMSLWNVTEELLDFLIEEGTVLWSSEYVDGSC